MKELLGLGRMAAGRWTPVVRRAIDRGVEFLLSRDPAVADYPMGCGNTRPSSSWFRLGFPSGDVSDVLQVLEALTELGHGRDVRLGHAIEWLLAQQDGHARWGNRYAYNGKTAVDFELQGKPSKRVTPQACAVLRHTAARARRERRGRSALGAGGERPWAPRPLHPILFPGGGLTSTEPLGSMRAAAVAGPSQRRLGYIDAVKGLVVAGVIVAHAAMTYGLVGTWPYQEVMHPLPQAAAYSVAFVTMLGMGLLFLVAGLFTPSALQHRGPLRFTGDRSLRLGIPTVAYLMAIMPAVNFVGRWASGTSAAAAADDALDHLRRFDLGPMWFVLALLLVTVSYVGWQAVSRTRAAGVGGRDLLLLAALSAGGTFLVRMFQPVDDPAPINVAGWPPDFLLFALGALAGRGWLVEVPSRTLRHAAALVAGGIVLLVPLAVLPTSSFSDLLGGWHWQSAVVSASESLVTIGLTVVIFRQFQRIRRDPLPWITRGSFTAYLVQTPVILLLGIAMRPVALAPEFKVVIVAVLGLAACFGLAAGYRGWTRGRRLGQGRRENGLGSPRRGVSSPPGRR